LKGLNGSAHFLYQPPFCLLVGHPALRAQKRHTHDRRIRLVRLHARLDGFDNLKQQLIGRRVIQPGQATDVARRPIELIR